MHDHGKSCRDLAMILQDLFEICHDHGKPTMVLIAKYLRSWLRYKSDHGHHCMKKANGLTTVVNTGSFLNCKQDGRQALAFFSSNYKYFDQLLPIVKNETIVLNLVFKGFLQISIPPLISIFHAKEMVSRFSVENFLSHSAEKICTGNPSAFQKNSGIENFHT